MTLRKTAPHARQRWSAALTVVAIATLVFAAIAVASHPLASLDGSDFEIDVDANLEVDDTGKDDWASVGVTPINDAPTGRSDNSYAGGAKEDDTCPGTTTGSIPNNKSDLLAWGIYEEEGDPGFLHLFWSRVNEPSGTTLMDFELNQSGTDCGNGVNKLRSIDDLLIEYRIEQGGATATLKVREWTGTAWGAAVDLTAVAAATGTINDTAISQSDSAPLSGALSPRTFGEASLDLSFVFDEGECRSFGSAFLKSRASDSFTSQLKDFVLPAQVSIDNCGSVEITKTDDADNPMEGAEFTLYESDGDGDFEPGTDDPIGQDSDGNNLVCTTDATGFCSIDNVLFGDYWVDETVVPSGHDKDANLPELITVDSTTAVELTYVNPRNRGSIIVAKVDEDGNPLGGASFALDEDGDPETTDDQTSVPAVDGETGLFCIDGLLLGSYTVVETVVPDGYSGEGPKSATVSTASTCADRLAGETVTPDLTFENERLPGAILVIKTTKDKGSTSGSSPLAGVTFTVTDADEEAVGSDVTDADGFACIGGLEVGATYDVTETAVPEGYAVDSSKTASITITDDATCEDILDMADPTTHADRASFSNDPLSEIEIIFRSLAGDGVTVATEVSCTGPDEFDSDELGPLDDEESAIITDLLEGEYVCTIVVDP